jgi:hypothetical protein
VTFCSIGALNVVFNAFNFNLTPPANLGGVYGLLRCCARAGVARDAENLVDQVG